MRDLKPCPFCGRQAELRYTEEGFAYIVCANDGCYVRTDGHLNEDSAIRHWNKRFAEVGKMYSEIRAEAINEFTERLTDKADLIKINAFDSRWAIWQEDIDNLVKEVVGDDNG